MKHLALLILLISNTYAADDEDMLQLLKSDVRQNNAIETLNSKICDVQVRIDKLEAEESGTPARPAYCAPAFQFQQSFTPTSQTPAQQPAYVRPPNPNPKDPGWKWSDRLGKWFYFAGRS